MNEDYVVLEVEKLLAIIQLMNVTKYLNGDWQPDWSNRNEIKYYISLYGGINIYRTIDFHCLDIYFKSKELAEQAVGILGEETIRLALCTDW